MRDRVVEIMGAAKRDEGEREERSTTIKSACMIPAVAAASAWIYPCRDGSVVYDPIYLLS